MKKMFLQGLLTCLAAILMGGAVVALLTMKFGLAPVNADQRPSDLEARLFGMILHAAVARHAREVPAPAPPTEESLIAGASIYTQLCAKCHGQPEAGNSVYGASFYPPAPQLIKYPSQYTEAEIFWIIKHGIRNTAMPAWGGQLSDEDIQQAAAFLKRIDALPAAVAADWRKGRLMGPIAAPVIKAQGMEPGESVSK